MLNEFTEKNLRRLHFDPFFKKNELYFSPYQSLTTKYLP